MEKWTPILLVLILFPPVLANSYIIEPPKNKFVVSWLNCNPIYGTSACSIELNEEQVKLLKSEGYKIYPNFKVHAFLNESVPQIRAHRLWEISVNGENLTGKGQTVCIIDTGIDYNHSALGGGWGNKVIAGYRFLDNGNDTKECNSSNPFPCYDDNGHGTHVAGIVGSTNETYKGVAPDSKLVVVKVLDSFGFGWLSDVISGINYCVNHSEEYNISVISMSLGTYETWSDYCDDDENLSVLVSAINNATAKNISVIVASGNEYNSSAISLPACIQNATPVGSVNSEDSISSFSNLWNLPQLFAPGEVIYSTWPDGWETCSGTSMATPHVAGAFALIKQYLKLSNETRTPQELEELFINTGISIDGNENHSRVDPYLTYLNLSWSNVSVIPKKLELILEQNSTGTKNITIISAKNINITVTFANLSSDGQVINNSNIFAWVDGNLSHNATGNETLIINNTNSTIININLTIPEDCCGIYTGKIDVNLTDGSSSITIPITVKANVVYILKKKIEIQTDCETKNYRVKVGNISSFVIKGNFSNFTNSYIVVKKNGSEIARSSKTNLTEDKIQINNPEAGIFEIELGCLSAAGGNISNQSIAFGGGSEIFATWTISASSLELGKEEITLSLTPNNTTASNFNLTTNTTEENVTLGVENYYLVYNWLGEEISNKSYDNFTFIVPYSSNLSANLSWTNSTNNLTLILINLRTGESFSNFTGSTPITINLNSSQVRYGIWKASVFGEKVSTTENFNLTIKFLDNRFKINFTNIKHRFENKVVENGSAKNWSFYVGKGVVAINISLTSNATKDINLLLYNSTNLTPLNLVNSTSTINGSAYIFTENITTGYWTVLINNTNSTENYSYNLTITLWGSNITEIGNISNESYAVIGFNLTSPKNLMIYKYLHFSPYLGHSVTPSRYYGNIILTSTESKYNIDLNIDFSAAILKLNYEWGVTFPYIGNQTLFAGEIETYNTTRNFYININQSKTLDFIVDNDGLYLENLTVINSTNLTNGIFALDFVNITLGECRFGGTYFPLHVTIEAPKNSSYLSTYQGWIYLNSSNGQPFNYLNLTLNITVTNKTIPRIEKRIYYFSDPEIKYRIYFYDNHTLDTLWNSSAIYNLTLKNSTGAIKNLSFSYSSGLFSSKLNTTNLTEGNYSIIGTITDLANNEANINLSFELLRNLNLAIAIPNNNSIVRGEIFFLKVNVSKLGNISARNVTVCLELPEQIKNLTPLCNTSVGDINQSTSKLLTWQLNGTERGIYTINVTANSSDLKFNTSANQTVEIKYGDLIVSLYSAPSSKEVNESFSVTIKIKNNGTWNASNVSAKIEVCGTTKNTDCSKKNIAVGSYITCKATNFICSSPDTYNIYAIMYGVINATCHGSECGSSRKIGEITITSPSTSGSSDGQGTTTEKIYDISFSEPSKEKFSIAQGEKKTLNVVVKNTGNTKIHDGYLQLSNIDSNIYKITPTEKRDFNSGKTLSFEIEFDIPENFEAKSYSITLTFKSDEYEESKKITLEILKVDLSFNLTDIEIAQGEEKEIEFYLKNIGEAALYNLNVNLSGINASYFNITPSQINSLQINKKTYITLALKIPKSAEIGERNLSLTVNSDKKSFQRTIKLVILPCEEKKSEINSSYRELKNNFETLLEQLDEAKKEGKNVTLIEGEIKEINSTLKTIETYLAQENYAEAEKLIKSLSGKVNSLFNELQKIEVKKEEFPLLIVAILIAIALLSVIFIYLFVLPQLKVLKAHKTQGYTFKKRRYEFINKLKELLKKLKYKKSTEEEIRKKKLKEWQKHYKESKKKKYGV